MEQLNKIEKIDFDLETLNKLANSHRELMSRLKLSINQFETNKDIYEFIDNFIKQNNLTKAFPIGISINQVIAHDSYHTDNLKKLKSGDFIKIDVGFIELGNIIDCARTFIYKSIELVPKSIIDSEEICKGVEDYIRKQIESVGKVSIQKISALTNALIVTRGYSALDYLGGHTIEYGKVHGSQYIFNKPINLLPKEAAMFIDASAEIGEGEMFAIEIYIGEKKDSGTMIKSSIIPVTHYQVAEQTDLSNIALKKEESELIVKLLEETKGLAYEYHINSKYNPKIIKNLIGKNAIVKHDALEYKASNPKEKIKFVQYEDCFIIKDNKLINLSK